MTARTPAPAAPDLEARTSRAPQQERGQRRVEQILDAAEQIFVEHGVGGATMQLIADRAGASVGSLYHFFPNKEAVVEALGARYADAVRDTNVEAMPLTVAHLPAPELFDRILRAQVEFIERTPAFDTVHEAVQRNCPAINDAMNQALVGHVGQFMALRYPTMPEPERIASAMVSVAAVHAVVDLSCRLPAEVREMVIREAHTMLVSHYIVYDAKYGAGAASL
jgi:AcrR family transcriptional regulator